MFEAEQVQSILAAADVQVKAMILLVINCGFGNANVGTLPQSAIDFKRGWVSHPRPKTAVERHCPLWRETVQAIREAITVRPTPEDPEDDRLMFITVMSNFKCNNDNAVNVGVISTLQAFQSGILEAKR